MNTMQLHSDSLAEVWKPFSRSREIVQKWNMIAKEQTLTNENMTLSFKTTENGRQDGPKGEQGLLMGLTSSWPAARWAHDAAGSAPSISSARLTVCNPRHLEDHEG